MNKQDFILIIGWFVTAVNTISLICSTFSFCRFFWKSVREEKIRWKINLYYTLTLIICLPFWGANCLAWYRFFDNWIVKHSFSNIETILNGFGDRILMMVVSIGLVIISLINIPSLRHGRTP